MTVENIPISYSEDGFNLSGELTFSTASTVLDKANSHLANLKTDTVTLDLSKLDKIDSAGITLLLAWKRSCETINKKLQINNTQKQAVSLIKTNKLGAVLNIST